MKKKIMAMMAAMMCLASSSLSYSSVAIAANSLNSNDIAEVKITSSDLKECNLVTESKNDGCWINFDLVSGAFAMSGNNHQSFSIIGSFERKDNDLYLYPENGSAEFYILHREEDHFVSQSDEIGVQLKAGLVFYADNDAFWEILLDWTLSGNEPSNTGETAEQNTSFIMGDVNDDGVFSVSDVVLLQKWLLAVPDTHLANWKAADFCEDNKLDVFDLTLMKRAMIYGESGQPISPTTQPIGLNHTEEVIELLKNYDLNDYNEAYRKSLQKMFDRFNEDGYFYHFADSENEENKITLNEDQTNAAIWLMPYANLEDSGILYHVAYQGKYYQVYYYFTDPAYTVSDLWEYMAQRLRIKNINIVDEKFGIVDNSNDEQTDMSAYFAVDDTHYCKIRTFEPEDALMDFLQVLKYEKLDIADNSEVFVPVNSSDTDLDKSAIAGKIFAYEKEGAGGYCTLSFNENGRFLYSPGKLSRYMDGGDWKIDGDTVSLIGMENKTIYLKITDDTLVYIAEGSDEFPYMDIKDGEKFVIYRPEISADKFQLNSRYSEYGLGDPKVELDLIVSELPEFCYVEDVRLYDEDDNFIGMMSPAMDADIWNYLVDCHVTEECSKTYYTLSKIRCGEKTYLNDVRSEITVNFKATPAP